MKKLYLLGIENLRKVSNTILLLNQVLRYRNGIDYLVVKTFKGFLDVTYDVDIVVHQRDLPKAVKALIHSGKYIIESFESESKLQLKPLDSDFLPVGIASCIEWHNVKLICEELWDYPSQRIHINFNNINFFIHIPYPPIDALSHIYHILFENHLYTIPEAVYVSKVLNSLTKKQIDIIINISKLNGTVNEILGLLDDIMVFLNKAALARAKSPRFLPYKDVLKGILKVPHIRDKIWVGTFSLYRRLRVMLDSELIVYRDSFIYGAIS